MEYPGFTPPVQQLLGMFHAQPFLASAQIHPAFLHHHQAVGRDAEILQQRLLAVCSPTLNNLSANLQVNSNSRGGVGGRNFTIDAILGNKENSRRQLNFLAENGSGDRNDNGGFRPETNFSRMCGKESSYDDNGNLNGGKMMFGGSPSKQLRLGHHGASMSPANKAYEVGDFNLNRFQAEHRNLGKNKRVRTIFTPEQLERLEAVFKKQQYMVGTERYYLAASLNLSEAQVKVWFQNRRIKWRKHQFEEQHQRLQAKQTFLDSDSESDDMNNSSQDLSHYGKDLSFNNREEPDDGNFNSANCSTFISSQEQDEIEEEIYLEVDGNNQEMDTVLREKDISQSQTKDHQSDGVDQPQCYINPPPYSNSDHNTTTHTRLPKPSDEHNISSTTECNTSVLSNGMSVFPESGVQQKNCINDSNSYRLENRLLQKLSGKESIDCSL